MPSLCIFLMVPGRQMCRKNNEEETKDFRVMATRAVQGGVIKREAK